MRTNVNHTVKKESYQWHKVKWRSLIKNNHKFIVAHTINISVFGAVIETLESFPLHQTFPIMIKATTPQKKFPIYVTAQVDHSSLKENRYNTFFQFKQILPKDKEFIDNLMEYLF